MNEKDVIATDSTGIKSMRGNLHGQIYVNNLNSLDGMKNFLRKILPKWYRKKQKTRIALYLVKILNLLMKLFPKKNSSLTHDFFGKFYQISKKKKKRNITWERKEERNTSSIPPSHSISQEKGRHIHTEILKNVHIFTGNRQNLKTTQMSINR